MCTLMYTHPQRYAAGTPPTVRTYSSSRQQSLMYCGQAVAHITASRRRWLAETEPVQQSSHAAAVSSVSTNEQLSVLV
jgi:hypothetical protein